MLDCEQSGTDSWGLEDWPQLRSQTGAGELTDEQWTIVRPLVGPGRYARLEATRRKVEGLAFLCRSECNWRDLPHDFGKSNSIYVRCRRWAATGVLDTLIEAFISLNVTKDWHPADRRGPSHPVFDERCEPAMNFLRSAILLRVRRLRLDPAILTTRAIGPRPIQRLFIEYAF